MFGEPRLSWKFVNGGSTDRRSRKSDLGETSGVALTDLFQLQGTEVLRDGACSTLLSKAATGYPLEGSFIRPALVMASHFSSLILKPT
jgi:hypothetical protein